VVKISPGWVTGPEQIKSSGRIATFSLWTGMFRDGIEIGSDHYLLCAKVNFLPRWLSKSNKKTPLKQDEFLKVRLLNDESIRWLYTQRVKLHLSNIKEDEIDIEKEWKKLTKHIKISSK